MEQKGYSRLEVKNSWQYLTYFFKGEQIPEKKPGSVLLANGYIVNYIPVEEEASYTDCGGVTKVKRYVLRAEINWYGQKLIVNLADLDIQEIWLKEFKKPFIEVKSKQEITKTYRIPMELKGVKYEEAMRYIHEEFISPIRTDKDNESIYHTKIIENEEVE